MMTVMTGPKILLEGRPGIGKTTVARALVRALQQRGVLVSGFTSEEIRDGRRRVGFRVQDVSGSAAVLAHVRLPGPPTVGRYGVDVATFERIALPAVAQLGGVVVIDELGKMELASEPFRNAVSRLFESDRSVVATVHAFPHPFTDAIKHRTGVETIRVLHRNRDTLPEELAERLS
jgi:nucleoside-triphosphatase